jgi:hypothetical protein
MSEEEKEEKLPPWAAAWTGTYEEDMKYIEEMRKTDPDWGKTNRPRRRVKREDE